MSRKLAQADVAIVGGGVAGLVSALVAADEADVVVLSKGPLLASASFLAQGGVAAALGEDDSAELHAEDTLRAGRGLCRPSAVAALTAEALARVRDLVELGVEFDSGLGLEGGHSRRRVVHAGGAATGARILRVLAEHALAHPRIQVREGERVVELEPGSVVRTDRGIVAAPATILATGGYSALWERTTNPPASVGDGIVLAYRAGAAVADLELVQFHPTVLASNGLLLSEALRGEGALLLDGQGRRFTDELAPRDVVAREIGARGTALLDLRPVDRSRFPTLVEKLEAEGLDPARDPIPVSPAAHYTMGGIVTDLDGRTELPGLYAAGECASTGVHGANRLASNSLLECLVFGRRAALAALADPLQQTVAREERRTELRVALADEPGSSRVLPPSRPLDPSSSHPLQQTVAREEEAVTDELRRALWCDAGLVRDAAGLERLRRAPHLLARLIAASALAREESRGGHFRADFPLEDEAFAAHTVLRPGRPPAFETWT